LLRNSNRSKLVKLVENSCAPVQDFLFEGLYFLYILPFQFIYRRAIQTPSVSVTITVQPVADGSEVSFT
jgi:hypothetical protein